MEHLSVDLSKRQAGGFSMFDLRNRILQPAAELSQGQVRGRGQIRRPASGASYSRFVEETGRWASVHRKTDLPLFELRSKDNYTGRKEDREGLTPMPKILLLQVAVADWRQPLQSYLWNIQFERSSNQEMQAVLL